MKKLLIAGAGIGGGHNRAAEALCRAASLSAGRRIHAEWFDSLSCANRAGKLLYVDSYHLLANRLPQIWSGFYRLFYGAMESPVASSVRQPYGATFERLARQLIDRDPDILLCTHFTPAHVAIDRIPGRRFPVYLVITDYDCHAFWINPAADGYFVGNDRVRSILRRRGIPGSKVHVTGIPILPEFSSKRDEKEILREFRLPGGVPLILIMGGGIGLRLIRSAVRSLRTIQGDLCFVVLCGRNESIRAKLEERTADDPRFRILGFTSQVHDLMQVAHLLVSKAGGLTVSEALARHLPMVLFQPTPGQEFQNMSMLLREGAALWAESAKELRSKVSYILSHPAHHRRMRSRAAALARPNAAADIIQIVTSSPDRRHC